LKDFLSEISRLDLRITVCFWAVVFLAICVFLGIILWPFLENIKFYCLAISIILLAPAIGEIVRTNQSQNQWERTFDRIGRFPSLLLVLFIGFGAFVGILAILGFIL
jgi:hypothetical protein